MAGLVVFLVASVPFLQLRASQTAGSVGTVADILSPDAMARRAAQARPTTENMFQTTVMRFDLLGELSQVVSLYPSERFMLGGGMASQVSILVPGVLWPHKREYLQTKLVSDEMIMREAGMRPSDIAGTAALYTYADFGWLAPLAFVIQLLLFLWAISAIIGLCNSYAVYLLGMGTALTILLQVDSANFSMMLFGVAYFAVFAVGMALVTLLSSVRVVGASRRRMIPVRRSVRY